ncbi:MAG TPA: hypothetical protein VJ852_07460 [Gemmatimonadaceae bacterium]|nr:hypothetical protein [Gemmatimonadaceae bacterium]
MKRQPRFFNRGKRKAPLIAALVQYRYYFLPGITFDTGYLNFVGPPARRIPGDVRRDHRLLSAEATPVFGVAERSFDARRRHFEHVPLSSKIVCVELGLDGAGCCSAIVDRDSFAIFPLDPDVENGTTFTAAQL